MTEPKKDVDNPHLVPANPIIPPGPVTPAPTQTKDAQGKVLAPKVAASTAVGPLAVAALNAVPPGSMDIKDVVPGYGPGQGSPKEGDPTRLANPENPLSPVTVPSNPSNPANMAQTQSDKPASEQRIYNDLLKQQAGSGTQSVETPEAKATREKKIALLKEIGDFLKQYPDGESHIPHTSPYWAKVNEYRALNNP